jgi:NAD(P)-dependent dehydrogenase (short-subunit alcohol dehydrogenase family)
MSLNPPIRDWQGVRVWIIGASTGIGADLARQLAAKGARIAASARNAAALAALCKEIPGARPFPLDITDAARVRSAHEAIVKSFGGVDLTVFVAGMYVGVRAWELTVEVARKQVEANLMGVYNGLAVVLPELVARGSGGVAIVSSVAGYRGLPKSLVYGATKAALINVAETLYLDLQPKGIAVYVINPGFVETPMTAQNDFKMPALIKSDEAAREIVAGFERGEFEIHFPKRFTGWLKLLQKLPYPAYFAAVRRFTGL